MIRILTDYITKPATRMAVHYLLGMQLSIWKMQLKIFWIKL
jgi:hypothetical protein